jgi:hypothetical protein
VSARHQVKRLDRPFEEFENRSGRRKQFSSFGADPFAPQFHRRFSAQVKSGPDVFADALVPSAAAVDARRVDFPKFTFAMSQRSRPKRVCTGSIAIAKPRLNLVGHDHPKQAGKRRGGRAVLQSLGRSSGL